MILLLFQTSELFFCVAQSSWESDQLPSIWHV